MKIPNQETLQAWDDQHVWHPFTPHSVFREEEPLMVVSGEGNYLIDIEGRRLLDGVSSIWCNTFGHRNARIDAAIKEQMEKISHATMLGNSTVPATILAKRLADLAPGNLTRVFYSDNGSTACEIALKMAYQYMHQRPDPKPEKKKFLALSNAYNGDTLGAVSVGGIDLFHERFRTLLFDVLRGPSPYAYRCDSCQGLSACGGGCLAEMERLMRAHAHELVGVIIEPGMQGAGGIITYPEGFLKGVRALCDELDILLICDEVAVGIGRSGYMFASEREGVVPDFICVAKMLTGGYIPVAATLTSEKVFAAFLGRPELGRTFFHGHTFTGNPLGCAAALAVLDIFEEENVLERLREVTIPKFEERLKALAHPNIGSVRSYGLGAGIELVADASTRQSFASSERRGMKVCRRARDLGVFLRPLSDVIVLMPPLSITNDEIDVLFDAVEKSIQDEFQG